MSELSLLLSIRPEYAEKILRGKKTVELRRVCPKISKGDLLIVYVTAPIKELKAILIVDNVITSRPDNLWEQVSTRAGITKDEFDSYFYGVNKGSAIVFKDIFELVYPVKLAEIREKIPGFRPPQCYQYFSKEDLFSLLSLPFNYTFDYRTHFASISMMDRGTIPVANFSG